MKNTRGRALFIGPKSSGRPAKGHTSGGSCPVVQRLSRTSMYYPEGTQKVAYVWWSHVRPPIRFAERTSNGPPAYVHTTDNSVRPPNLAYVRPKVQITLLAALVTQSPNQLPQLSHLCVVSNLGHYTYPQIWSEHMTFSMYLC
jgi:hypothetical protein